MRSAALAAILASTTILSGCAGTIAGVSLSSISSFAGFASTIFTGADLGEHAASLVTGKDCRFSEGLVREDRSICEEKGSPATRDDFHGIFVERIDEDGTVIYAAPKYMSASVGAGENENNTDVIWAQIKTQKAQEETARQLAKADTGQQIDVAALASGSLSPDSLAFLPIGFQASVQTIDEEPASQTAARPRDLNNSVAGESRAPARTPVQTMESEPPALDEKAFMASMTIAHATGSGGPFIAANTSSAPVVSTLVNGEPILVMKIGPIVSPLAMSAPSEFVSAEPMEVPAAVEAAPIPASEPASPQSLISSLPKAQKKVPVALPAVVEPPAKPKAKPAPVEVAESAPAKPVKAKPEPGPAPTIAVEDDVYQPPTNDVFTSAAPDLIAPTAAFSDLPPAPKPVEEEVIPASSAPAPLIPMAQP